MNQFEPENYYQKKTFPGNYLKIGMIVFIIGLVLSALAFYTNPARASYDSIIIYMFIASIAFGSLFLVCLEYLAGAVWSVPFRRISEILASLLFFLPLFALPGFINIHQVFQWAHIEEVALDSALTAKSPYLNPTFFVIRNIIIYLVAIIFYIFIVRNSGKQDISREQKLTTRNIRVSAVFMPFFAISVSILAIDWMMSLEPHWFSTIFGVYYFAGTVLAALAALTYLSINLNEKGFMMKGITKDHYYSLGALLFAFTNFWAYIAFSQFMLIWYANLPEETSWFISRWAGSWKYISVGIIFVRFLIPYSFLLSQPSKMNPKILKRISLFILFSHLYDIYWLVMPNYAKEGIGFSWMDISFPLLGIGFILIVFNYVAKNKNLAPIGDPKFQRALEFHL